MHIKAPAGAGKTFLGLHLLLDKLEENPDARVLFVARNYALSLWIAKWIWVRGEKNVRKRKRHLAQLSVLFEPLGDGPRKLELGGDGRLRPGAAVAGSEKYDLVIVDEAHHIYRHPEKVAEIAKYVAAGGKTRRVLLSDVSQATDEGLGYPDDLTEVPLTEVVRCSRRAVVVWCVVCVGVRG